MSVTPIQPPPGGPVGPEAKKNDSTLLIVILVGAVLCFFCFVGIIAAIAIPNLIEARKGSNEAAAIGALRTLTTAQALFREGDKDHNDELDYARDLSSLQRAGLIDGVLGSGLKQGYRFAVESPDNFHWSATAVPQSPGKSGDRSFFVDESGVIRFRDARTGAASARDTAIGG